MRGAVARGHQLAEENSVSLLERAA